MPASRRLQVSTPTPLRAPRRSQRAPLNFTAHIPDEQLLANIALCCQLDGAQLPCRALRRLANDCVKRTRLGRNQTLVQLLRAFSNMQALNFTYKLFESLEAALATLGALPSQASLERLGLWYVLMQAYWLLLAAAGALLAGLPALEHL
jgi:hypothetical protein